jgi:thiol-disulfide isomerase/thioredoxin
MTRVLAAALLGVLLACLAPAPAVAAPAVPAEAPPATDMKAEMELVKDFRDAHGGMDLPAMTAALNAFKDRPLVTRAGLNAMIRNQQEAMLIGEPLPTAAFRSLTWMQGQADVGGDQLLVFAEQWCPHCRRALPSLPGFAASNGLQLVIVTQMSRRVTPKTLMTWIAEAGVTGPVGHDARGELREAVGVGPVPSALLVRDGIVVWRGHPNNLTRPDSPALAGAMDRRAPKRLQTDAAPLRSAVARPWPTVDEPPPSDEEAAGALLRESQAAMSDLRWIDARAALDALTRDHADSQAARSATRVLAEVETVGRTVPAAPYTPLQGTLTWPPSGPTVVVFWEVWCPHCKVQVPKVAAQADRFAGRATFVGLTKLTRSATRESVLAYLSDEGIGLAMAVEGGDISQTFNVSGVPAAAVVRDGRIVWRGHPARLDDATLERVLALDLDHALDGIAP